MVRTFFGGLVAGLILFAVGFVFWATPLAEMAYENAGEQQSAAVQTALAANLTQSGTGTYLVPSPNRSAAETVLYGKGPVATVHFNTKGFAVEDTNMLVTGLSFALVAGLLLAFGLASVGRGRDFGDLAPMVVLFSLAFTIWGILAQPVFNHYGWGHWVYDFIASNVAWIVAGLVVARWFVPRAATVAAPAPAPYEPAAAAEDEAPIV